MVANGQKAASIVFLNPFYVQQLADGGLLELPKKQLTYEEAITCAKDTGVMLMKYQLPLKLALKE